MANDPNIIAKNTTYASRVGADATRGGDGLTNLSDWRSFFGSKPADGWGLHGKEPDAITTEKNALAPRGKLDAKPAPPAPPAPLNPASVAKMDGPDLRIPNAISDFPVGPEGQFRKGGPQPLDPAIAPDMAKNLTGPDWSSGAFDANSIHEQTINNATASLSRMGSKPSTASMFQSIGGSLGWDEPV